MAANIVFPGLDAPPLGSARISFDTGLIDFNGYELFGEIGIPKIDYILAIKPRWVDAGGIGGIEELVHVVTVPIRPHDILSLHFGPSGQPEPFAPIQPMALLRIKK